MVKGSHPAAEVDTITAVDNGPDALLPADSYFATRLDQPVKLRLTEANSGVKYPPMSAYTMFKNTVTKFPNSPALAYKKDNTWAKFTFQEYFNMCRKAAKSFIHLGLEPSNVVCLLGFNSPHWFISHLGAIFAGGIGCGVYTTNQTDACEFIFNDCKAQFVVVENKQQLDKVISRRQNLPNIKYVIQYTGEIENTYDGFVISWQKFIDSGIDVTDAVLDARIKTIAPNKCASLIYTSGTTGQPKAALISHDCITYTVRHGGVDIAKLKTNEERFISYLPLSHIAAQMVDIFTPLYIAATVYFAQPDALRGSLATTLAEVRPTYFFGVPRVWEKMQEKISSVVKTLTGTKLSLYQWATKLAYEHTMETFVPKEQEVKPSFSYSLAKLIMLNKIHRQLGLDKCRNMFCGAAPVTKETLEFFISLGLPLAETFGMSETSGPHSIGVIGNNRLTSVGAVGQFNRSKLINKEPDGSGELCVSGRHIFMGYLNSLDKTKEAFTPDGWLRTGDIAKIDDEGFLYITGRLKELIITAGGENIAPVPIEDNLKAELPDLISNSMLVGDKRKYLVILITLKCNMNMDTLEPLDTLTDDAIKWLKSQNSKSTTVSGIIRSKDPVVYSQIEKALKRANEKSTSRAAKVQKFAILPRDFSLFHGELGPTLKLRRPIVTKMYASVIDELYVDAAGAGAE